VLQLHLQIIHYSEKHLFHLLLNTTYSISYGCNPKSTIVQLFGADVNIALAATDAEL